MKKILVSILLVAVLAVGAFALVACNKNETKIGVQSGTTGQGYVLGNADMEFAGYDNIKCMAYDNGGLAVKAMLDGNVDYVIIDNEPAKQLVAANAGAIKMIDVALSAEEYAFGVDKNQPALLSSINTIIMGLKAKKPGETQSELDKIFAKYDSLQYDDDGNVIGGDDHIVGIDSAEKSNDGAAQLVVATNAAFAPFEYKKGDKFAGIDMEIAKIIADSLGLELVIADMEFDAVVTSVGKNNIDVAMSGLTVNASRKQVINFTESYFQDAYQVLLVPANNTEFDGKTKAEIEAILASK